MKKLLVAILTLVTLFACTNNSEFENQLDKASSIIESDADSAYAILSRCSGQLGDVSESLRMRYYLLYADAQNKLDGQLPSDSVFHEVVEYYDQQHGSSNEQMKAHYLMGCIYRDLMEAPVALQCYYDAIDKADTVDENCDYLTLMSVWGQVAVVLYYQHLPEQQLAAWNNYSRCAQKLGDTYEYIRGIDLSTMAYSQMNDTATVVRMTHELFKMYCDNGYIEDAYGVYPPLIDILLSRGRYSEARRYMDAYEQKSGMFKDGEITVPGRQLYYQSKGIYYCGVGKLDSAELYYRKLLAYPECEFNAYKGLAEVYCERRIVDSVINFTRLQELALDERLSQNQIDAAQQATSMYDYSRMQRIADEKRAEAKLNALLLVFAVFVFIVVVVALYYLHKRYAASKEEELETLNDSYEKTKTEYVHVVEDLTEQKQEYEQFRRAKLSEVADLKSKYKDLKSKDDEAALLNTPFILGMRDILKPHSVKEHMTNADIDELLLIVRQYLPHFFMAMMQCDTLSQHELIICILLRLNFTVKDITVLLNTSSSSVANAKKRANEKLFGMSQANILVQNLKNMGADNDEEEE
ncbi:MAG: hypothetical protein J5663_05400 [Bacteroidaceae bacterium]|nr:hypothetical protein [Bacteroidaceae bacterium]